MCCVQGGGAREMKKRPRDFSQAAKLVVDIASGQVEDREPIPETGLGKRAQAGGFQIDPLPTRWPNLTSG